MANHDLPDNIMDRTALQIAQAIRAGEVSSLSVTNQYLDKINANNDALGAFVSVHTSNAIRAAKKADRDLSAGNATGVFHGVPTGVKDLDPVRGTRTRMGSRAFRAMWSPMDGPVAKRLRAGGFVFLGKLAASEFGVMPITETDLHPPCRNPLNTAYSAGGSSGGSSSAVAGGLLPIAQGSDGGGSIRIPASFCGLFGHKPSRGLHPHFFGKFDRSKFATAGALARDVEDSAAMLDVLAGRQYNPNKPPADSLLAQSRDDVAKLRIHYSVESTLGDVDPIIAEGVRETARLLTSLGHSVYERPIFRNAYDEMLPVYGWTFAQIPVLRNASLQPVTQWIREHGRKHSPHKLDAVVGALTEEVHEWFGEADVWLTATVPEFAPKVGAWRELPPAEQFAKAGRFGSLTAMFNVSGQPAASIPTGENADGLPFGVQLAGRTGEDGALLALCRELQEARPWSHRVAISG